MKAHSIGPEPPYSKSETPDAKDKKEKAKKDPVGIPKTKKRKASEDTEEKPNAFSAGEKVKKVKGEGEAKIKAEHQSPKVSEPAMAQFDGAFDIKEEAQSPETYELAIAQPDEHFDAMEEGIKLESWPLNPRVAYDGTLSTSSSLHAPESHSLQGFINPAALEQAANDNAAFSTIGSFPALEDGWQQPVVDGQIEDMGVQEPFGSMP